MNLKKVINKYKDRPDILKHDLRSWYDKIIYVIQNYVDPMPPRRQGENDRDYFDRIDPKFGIRYYGYIKKGNIHRDIASTMKYIEDNYPRAKDRKILKRLLFLVNQVETESDENYQRYITRRTFSG